MARRIGFSDGGVTASSAVRRSRRQSTGIVWFTAAVLGVLALGAGLSSLKGLGLGSALNSLAASDVSALREYLDPTLLGAAIPMAAFALILLNAVWRNNKRRSERSSPFSAGAPASTNRAEPHTPTQKIRRPLAPSKPAPSPWERHSKTTASPAQPTNTTGATLPLTIRIIGLAILTPMTIGFALASLTSMLEALHILRFAGPASAVAPAFLAIFLALVTRVLFKLFWMILIGKR